MRMRLQKQRCPMCERAAIDGITHPRCLTPYGLDGLLTIFEYEGVIKKAIKAIKYRFVSDIAATLITTVPVASWQHLALPKGTVLYPIPLHTERLAWRGFNQAEKLGIFVAQQLQLNLVVGLLTRVEKRVPQADISSRLARIKNAQGQFKAATEQLPTSILLFDDVWTTGATMKEAAKVLKRGGVDFIWGLTIAG